MAFINGDKIDLIPLNREHWNLYVQWINDEEIRKHVGFIYPTTTEEGEKMFRSQPPGTRSVVHFEIWHKKDNLPLGIISLFKIDWENRLGYIGFYIGNKSYWGQGIGTESLNLITNYGFTELNLRKICAEVYSPNLASIKCFEKIKFLIDATLTKEEYINGEYVDVIRYAMFKDEWGK